jgi:hypothetical protein
VSSVRSAGARRSCNVNARWRLVDFLTMETTVPRPQVLAMPPARARAHPKHDPMLTHHSAPCAPAGQPAVLLQCIFVAPSSRKPRVSCRRAEAGIMRPREQQWAAGAPAERDVGHGCARAARLPHARAWLCGLFAAPMRALVCMSARILVSRPAHQPMVPHRARGGGFRRQLNAYNMCIHTKTTERGPPTAAPRHKNKASMKARDPARLSRKPTDVTRAPDPQVYRKATSRGVFLGLLNLTLRMGGASSASAVPIHGRLDGVRRGA